MAYVIWPSKRLIETLYYTRLEQFRSLIVFFDRLSITLFLSGRYCYFSLVSIETFIFLCGLNFLHSENK